MSSTATIDMPRKTTSRLFKEGDYGGYIKRTAMNTDYSSATFMCADCGDSVKGEGTYQKPRTKFIEEICEYREKLNKQTDSDTPIDLTDIWGEDETLVGKYLIVSRKQLSQEYWFPMEQRVFKAEGGFGAEKGKIGSKVFGTYPYDNEKTYVNNWGFERLATSDEIEAARKHGEKLKKQTSQ